MSFCWLISRGKRGTAAAAIAVRPVNSNAQSGRFGRNPISRHSAHCGAQPEDPPPSFSAHLPPTADEWSLSISFISMKKFNSVQWKMFPKG